MGSNHPGCAASESWTKKTFNQVNESLRWVVCCLQSHISSADGHVASSVRQPRVNYFVIVRKPILFCSENYPAIAAYLLFLIGERVSFRTGNPPESTAPLNSSDSTNPSLKSHAHQERLSHPGEAIDPHTASLQSIRRRRIDTI